MSWRASYSTDEIKVYYNDDLYATYELLPETHCTKCASPLPTWACNNCSNLSGFTRVYALGYYRKARAAQQHQLTKHILDSKDARYIAKPLALALATVIENRFTELSQVDAIVPVPAHDTKLDQKGFNHADLLAIELGRYIEKPVLDCLEQVKYYRQTNASGRDERFENVKDAFTFMSEYQEAVKGRYLLLIDDILTTGATISKCSNVLISHGAKQVDALILGRTWSK